MDYGPFQQIDVDYAEPDPRRWGGWRNFDGTQQIYIFGYGSLVSAASVSESLGYELDPEDGTFPAILAGWRPSWNVGSDTGSHPEREFRYESGRVFEGMVAVLGIEPENGATCHGAVFAISANALPGLDRRERNYERRDVTDSVCWPGKPESCLVFTYVPRPGALHRLVDATRLGREVVISSSYFALVRAAFSEILPRRRDAGEDVTSREPDSVLAPHFPLCSLTQHVRLTTDRNR